MKKVMILGASATQVPLILKAKEMGMYVIVVSIPGSYPGFAYADKVYYLNTTDSEGILRAAQDEQIAGILTTGTDVAVRSIGYVNSAMGLTGISYESACLVTDKAKMKTAMRDAGVRTAEFYIAYSYEEARAACEKLGFPAMVKCTDQAASKGIAKVSCEQQLEDAVKNAFKWTKNPYIIVEKCIIGDEIGMDGFYAGEKNCAFLPHNKITINNGRTDVPVGHSVPFTGLSEKAYTDMMEQAKKCVVAMGLDHCFFNMDIMMSDEKAYIIEIGGRTGSTCIPDILTEYCGFNYYEKMLRNAIGEEAKMEVRHCGAVAAGFIRGLQDGTVARVEVPEGQLPQSTEYVLDVKPGDTTKKFSLGSDRIGQALCRGSSVEEAEVRFKLAQQILSEAVRYVDDR